MTVGPQPPPAAGRQFFAVHPGGGWSNRHNKALDEAFGFRITVSVRVADAPRDRSGAARLTELQVAAGPPTARRVVTPPGRREPSVPCGATPARR